MTLIELQEILGNRIEVTLSEMTPEDRQIENAQSQIILGIAKQMINNCDIVLRTEKLMAQNKSLSHSLAMDLICGKQ